MMSASKINLARECAAAFALPHTEERHEGQAEGDERHEDLEMSIKAAEIPDVLADRWPGYTWRSEVAYAIDLATGDGRELGVGIKRNYEAFNISPFEIVGTADLVGRGPAGELVIGDRKSFDPNVPRAAVNAQLHTLAVAAARAYDVQTAEVAIWHEARPLDVESLDAFDLDGFVVQLRQIASEVAAAPAKLRAGVLEPVTGRHCRYCPAFHACPKQAELAQLVKTDAISTRVEMTMPFRDDVQAADAYDLAKRIRLLLKRIESALYARASERPIPLSNGKMFGPDTVEGNDKLNGDVAYDVVRELYGQQIADAAVERKASKKGIKDAVAFVAGKGQVAAVERKVLAEIRARGGISNEMKIEIREYSPGPKALKAG